MQFADAATVIVKYIGFVGEGERVDRMEIAFDHPRFPGLAVGGKMEAVVVVGR